MKNKCLNVVINKRSLRTFEDCGVKVLFLIMSRTAACLKYADGGDCVSFLLKIAEKL